MPGRWCFLVLGASVHALLGGSPGLHAAGVFGHRSVGARSAPAQASALLVPPVASCRGLDQDRGLIAAITPAALLHACRLRGGHHDRRHHHRRRYALCSAWSASAEFIESAIGFAVPLIIAAVTLIICRRRSSPMASCPSRSSSLEHHCCIALSALEELCNHVPAQSSQPPPSPAPFCKPSAPSTGQFPDAVLLPHPWHRGIVEPARAERRHELRRRPAALRHLGCLLRCGAVGHHQRASALCRLRQASHVPGHRPVTRASELPAWLNELIARHLLGPRRQCRRRHRGVRAPGRARLCRAGATQRRRGYLYVCTMLTAAAGMAIALLQRPPHLHPGRQRRRRRAPSDQIRRNEMLPR